MSFVKHRGRRRPVATRFWEKVEKSTEDECWLWVGAVSSNGYGSFGHKTGSCCSSHCWAYEQVHGATPPDLYVLHKCDNRLCVNLRHLFLGTHQDNIDDMVQKGRNIKGEDAHNHKLTEEAVKYIRRNYIPWKRPLSFFAAKYNVDIKLIHRVVRGERWKHV